MAKLNTPAAVGVPLAVKVTWVVPVENNPDPEKLMPFCTGVVIE